MKHPAPRHVRARQTVCLCGQTTWNPDACDNCLALRDDEAHAAAEDRIETMGWDRA